MKFTIVIRESDPYVFPKPSGGTMERFLAQHRAFEAAVAERGTLVTSAALALTGTTLSGGKVTEGPYAETVEQISGLYVIDVASRDVAVELARLLPEEYTLEIRDPMALEGY